MAIIGAEQEGDFKEHGSTCSGDEYILLCRGVLLDLML